MLSSLFPFFPDPPAIEERHTQRITTLLTVEKLYKVCNVTYNVLGATGCAAAVNSRLVILRRTSLFPGSFMPWLSISLFFANLRGIVIA